MRPASATGSSGVLKTIGIVVVAALAAKAAEVLAATITLTFPTNLVNSEFRLRNLRRTVFNRHVLALGISGVLQTLTKCPQKIRGVRREQPDYRHRRLLRARRQRPALPPRRRREKAVRRPSKAE
jgi:hypothetical protein